MTKKKARKFCSGAYIPDEGFLAERFFPQERGRALWRKLCSPKMRLNKKWALALPWIPDKYVLLICLKNRISPAAPKKRGD